MLHVTIEMIPFGQDSLKSTISSLYIVNDGTGDLEVSNYLAFSEDPRSVSRPPGSLRPPIIARVLGHERASGAQELLRKVLSVLANAV